MACNWPRWAEEDSCQTRSLHLPDVRAEAPAAVGGSWLRWAEEGQGCNLFAFAEWAAGAAGPDSDGPCLKEEGTGLTYLTVRAWQRVERAGESAGGCRRDRKEGSEVVERQTDIRACIGLYRARLAAGRSHGEQFSPARRTDTAVHTKGADTGRGFRCPHLVVGRVPFLGAEVRRRSCTASWRFL